MTHCHQMRPKSHILHIELLVEPESTWLIRYFRGRGDGGKGEMICDPLPSNEA